MDSEGSYLTYCLRRRRAWRRKDKRNWCCRLWRKSAQKPALPLRVQLHEPVSLLTSEVKSLRVMLSLQLVAGHFQTSLTPSPLQTYRSSCEIDILLFLLRLFSLQVTRHNFSYLKQKGELCKIRTFHRIQGQSSSGASGINHSLKYCRESKVFLILPLSLVLLPFSYC